MDTPTDITRYKQVYFVGAGGIGMAALERWCLSRGLKVAGYDLTPSELTSSLQKEGVAIVFDDDPALIPADFRNPSDTLVVYTPAVPDSHCGLAWFRNNGFEVVKRARLLGILTRSTKAICIAGTHGKTTTSSMVAHMLEQSGKGCNAFLGGVLRNYGTNFLLSADSDIAVVEADEYDRSFHELRPTVAVVTSTDPDHLDIYGDEAGYLEGFAQFTELIYPGGALVVHTGLKFRPRPAENVRLFTYGLHSGDFHADNIRMGKGSILFDFIGPDGLRIADIDLGVPVKINIENAVAALAALAVSDNLDPASAREALASFKGAKRRFEFHVKREYGALIDDYAHHPDEIAASIASVRALYPGVPLTVAFQPHLYTRTRDFAPQFAQALSQADSLIMLDLYPAREQPLPGISSDTIFSQVTISDKILIDRHNFPATVARLKPQLLLCLGAGDISNYVPEIAKAF